MRSVTPPPYLTRLFGLLTLIGCLLAPAGARAAGLFYVRGGGNGHGIGMSQYGADGYAQHGADYRTILAHYYQGTALGQTDPVRTVRVLLADGPSAAVQRRHRRRPAEPGRLHHLHRVGHARRTAPAERRWRRRRERPTLTVTGPGPLRVAGKGTYRGSLQLSARRPRRRAHGRRRRASTITCAA